MFELIKSQIWTILNRDFGSTYAVVTTDVMAAWLGGEKAAVGGCMGVVVKRFPL